MIIDNFKEIILNYISGWFFIDFLSSIPFDLIISEITLNKSGSSNLGFFKYIKYLKMLRIFKISRMLRIFKMIENSEGYKNLQIE